MGIDMATREELIAAEKSVEEIETEIGADSLSYLSIDSITAALRKEGHDLCLGCVTGEYPYEVDGEERDRDVSRPVIGSEQPHADD
jgi:amidophosphoribosyltransferase